MTTRPRRPLAVLTLVVLVALAGRFAPDLVGASDAGARDEQVPDHAQAGVVEKVVDGDTIWVRIDGTDGPLSSGATHKIRILEIDTPETQHPTKGVQCGGPEATAFAEEMIPVGSTVHLLADREDTDVYGRFLRYVWTDDGVFYNREAVRQGYARAVLYEPNDAFIEDLRAAEAEARAAGRGIWGQTCASPPE